MYRIKRRVREKRLLNKLRSMNDGIAESAAWELGKAGFNSKRVINGLLYASKDLNAGVRRASIYALGKTGNTKQTPIVINRLKDALNDKNADVRTNASIGLYYTIESPQVNDSFLIDLLKSSYPGIRAKAAERLGERGVYSALDQLLINTDDETERVRVATAKALGKIPSGQSVKPLTKMLERTYGFVDKSEALLALCKLNDSGIDITPAFDNLLGGLYDSDLIIRKTCATLLTNVREGDTLKKLDCFQKEQKKNENVETLFLRMVYNFRLATASATATTKAFETGMGKKKSATYLRWDKEGIDFVSEQISVLERLIDKLGKNVVSLTPLTYIDTVLEGTSKELREMDLFNLKIGEEALDTLKSIKNSLKEENQYGSWILSCGLEGALRQLKKYGSNLEEYDELFGELLGEVITRVDEERDVNNIIFKDKLSKEIVSYLNKVPSGYKKLKNTLVGQAQIIPKTSVHMLLMSHLRQASWGLEEIVNGKGISRAQNKALKEWVIKLERGELDKEQKSVIKFYEYVLKNLLNWPADNIEPEVEGVDYCLKDEDGRYRVAIEIKGAKQGLTAKQHRRQENRETPIIQTRDYLKKLHDTHPSCLFAIVTNFREFALFDRTFSGHSLKVFDITKCTNEENLKEFLGYLSYDSLMKRSKKLEEVLR